MTTKKCQRQRRRSAGLYAIQSERLVGIQLEELAEDPTASNQQTWPPLRVPEEGMKGYPWCVGDSRR